MLDQSGTNEAASSRAPSPDVISFTSTMAALLHAPNSAASRAALTLLRRIQEYLGEEAECTACFNAAITACGRAHDWEAALSLLREMQQQGPAPNVVSFNSAINAMGISRRWQTALALLQEAMDHGLEPDVVTYSSVISACSKSGEWQQALRILREMAEAGVAPNEVSYSAAISACEPSGEWVMAQRLLLEMPKVGLSPGVFAYCSAIAAASKGGAWREAIKLLLRMRRVGVAPNTATCNAAIDACAKSAEWQAAIGLLRRMLLHDRFASAAAKKSAAGATVHWPAADAISFNSVLAACDRAGEWRTALAVREQMDAARISANEVTDNTLLSALARAGQWQPALALLQAIQRQHARTRDLAVPICTAAAACETAGQWRAALRLVQPILSKPSRRTDTSFDELRKIDPSLAPQAAARRTPSKPLRPQMLPALAAAIRACARAGELPAAMWLLTQVRHASAPDPPTPKSMQSVLSLLPASVFISMRDAADASGETRLSASIAAMLAARREPNATAAGAVPRATFVLEGALVACYNGHNTSSAADIFITREAADKQVGTVDAARESRSLVARMRRQYGYVPRLAALPAHTTRGWTSVQRAAVLAQHCEKKALAAQLALGYPRPKLQVNRRMCADCHELFKVVSAALDVRIECLDAARLHVFADGACTCGDVQQERAARRPAAQSGGRAASPSRARGAVDRSELQRGRTPRQGG